MRNQLTRKQVCICEQQLLIRFFLFSVWCDVIHTNKWQHTPAKMIIIRSTIPYLHCYQETKGDCSSHDFSLNQLTQSLLSSKLSVLITAWTDKYHKTVCRKKWWHFVTFWDPIPALVLVQRHPELIPWFSLLSSSCCHCCTAALCHRKLNIGLVMREGRDAR